MFLSSYKLLVSCVAICFGFSVLAMEASDQETDVQITGQAKPKRTCLDDEEAEEKNIRGKGHQGTVYLSSPIKVTSPKKSRAVSKAGGAASRKRLYSETTDDNSQRVDDPQTEELTKIEPEEEYFRKGVRKKAKVDLTNEAKMQSEIRQALKEKHEAEKEDYYRFVPYCEVPSGETNFEFKMERAPGYTLERAIECFSQIEYLELMKEFMRFVTALHNTGYSHGDINSANIMVKRVNENEVGSVNKVMFLDYELSGKLNKDKQKSSGKAPYSAPEASTGCTMTTKLDVYSLGKVLLDKFGCIEFPEMHTLIVKMTLPDPNERIELREALAQLLEISKNFKAEIKACAASFVLSIPPDATVDSY